MAGEWRCPCLIRTATELADEGRETSEARPGLWVATKGRQELVDVNHVRPNMEAAVHARVQRRSDEASDLERPGREGELES